MPPTPSRLHGICRMTLRPAKTVEEETLDTDSWDCTVLLSDFAQVAEGKLYVLGGGWTLCGPGPFQHGLAIKVEVPWDEANRSHRLEGALFNEGMQVVKVGTNGAEARFEGTFEAGRPAGIPAGTPLDF